jgi:hypothetical protein
MEVPFQVERSVRVVVIQTRILAKRPTRAQQRHIGTFTWYDATNTTLDTLAPLSS